MGKWSNQMSQENGFKAVGEEEANEAHAFFKKRNPNVLSCMHAILEQIGSTSTESELTNNDQMINKEPPQILSNHTASEQMDTEYS